MEVMTELYVISGLVFGAVINFVFYANISVKQLF